MQQTLRERELLEENALLRNALAQLRPKAAAWDRITEIARCANIYSHLEPDEIRRVVAEAASNPTEA